ncbi:GNAT family N-acetyltransferase [Lysinibacillus sp. SGAir0095]|uniref:GNAT family N-acetyltransferase n=1 Tax=Lysinibacillus sp. SGAir0095 TaxID=2070463 RepID=UPI0010CD4D68|nr:GNAT family N-acetyltransferase [Lysinibacillus sp. SGAir0095]QCR31984.1 methicillin resistance protein [Lysinibacillus sp. SGAir0095]
MTDREKYRQFSETEKTIPLFSKGWWMDAVCQENWDAILIEENGQVVASLPYYLAISEERKEIQKAILTQTNGIWMAYPTNQKYEKKLAYETKLMNLVIDEIEQLELAKYQQYFHYSITNWLPFYWRGYSQTTRYTYVIQNTKNLEGVYQNFSSNIRKCIRKAMKLVEIKEDIEIEEFYHLNKLTFERQDLEIPYSYDVVKRLDEECKKRNACKTYYCVDEHDQIHSAIYFVWDEDSVYYLMSGSNPDFRHTQSLTLLLYEGIKLANKLNKQFNFEGSMKKKIEHHFRQFGAEQMPYHNIYKTY